MAELLRVPVLLSAEEPTGGFSSYVPLLYILVIGAFMYFMIIRPQRKRDAKARELMASLQVGMKITTVSGVVGKIINVKDDIVTIETSIERTQLDIRKWAVKDVDKVEEA